MIFHNYGVIFLFDYERFEELRASKGITKKFIAQALGRSATLCQDWKQGKSKPSEEQLKTVAEILGTSVSYLCGGESPARQEQDEELRELLCSLREREDMRMLFKLAKDASPEDVRQAVKIIEALRK